MRIKIALATAVAALVFTPATPAHAIPANCQAVPWGFLGSQVRAICDGPILPDGSWMSPRSTLTTSGTPSDRRRFYPTSRGTCPDGYPQSAHSPHVTKRQPLSPTAHKHSNLLRHNRIATNLHLAPPMATFRTSAGHATS